MQPGGPGPVSAKLSGARPGRGSAGRGGALRREEGLQAGSAYVFDTSGVVQPCRGDYNGDGVLNVNDFIAMQAAWRKRDARADFDRSGAFTVNDFISFQGAFVRGCT